MHHKYTWLVRDTSPPATSSRPIELRYALEVKTTYLEDFQANDLLKRMPL